MEYSTVGSILRGTQALCIQLCEKQTLEYGIAYYCDRFAALPEANQLREIIAESEAEVLSAYREAEDWFHERALCCRSWTPADGVASAHLSGFLLEKGFRPRKHVAMVLARWPDAEPEVDARVVPARAVRAAFRTTFLNADSPMSVATRELLAEAYNERLDDPQYDAVVALSDNAPAGRCALHQVGDVAHVLDLNVLPQFAGRGIEEKLLHHAIAMARRLAMRRIVAQVAEDRPHVVELFERLGFVIDGEIVEFEREAPGDAGGTP